MSKKKNLNYKHIKCLLDEYSVPEGYEIVPVGTKTKSTYKWLSPYMFPKGDSDINKWLASDNDDLIGKPILDTWCVHIRKKRVIKPKVLKVNLVPPHQYYYDYMKPGFQVPTGYELIPLGEKTFKSDFFSIGSKGSSDIADWNKNDCPVVYGNGLTSLHSFPHIRKIGENKVKVVQDKKEIKIPITLTPLQAVIYWRLLDSSCDDLMKLVEKCPGKTDKEAVAEFKESGFAASKSLWNQIDNRLKELGIFPQTFTADDINKKLYP